MAFLSNFPCKFCNTELRNQKPLTLKLSLLKVLCTQGSLFATQDRNMQISLLLYLTRPTLEEKGKTAKEFFRGSTLFWEMKFSPFWSVLLSPPLSLLCSWSKGCDMWFLPSFSLSLHVHSIHAIHIHTRATEDKEKTWKGCFFFKKTVLSKHF